MQLYITLAGANFRPKEAKDYIKADLHPGSVCTLEREPDNPYDSNAVKIICDGVFIGYVPRTDNAVLAMALDAGAEAKVKNNGFVGTIQPTFTIDFEAPSIEERNAEEERKQAEAKEEEIARANRRAEIDDEIPF